jgi:hypothetical protein
MGMPDESPLKDALGVTRRHLGRRLLRPTGTTCNIGLTCPQDTHAKARIANDGQREWPLSAVRLRASHTLSCDPRPFLARTATSTRINNLLRFDADTSAPKNAVSRSSTTTSSSTIRPSLPLATRISTTAMMPSSSNKTLFGKLCIRLSVRRL